MTRHRVPGNSYEYCGQPAGRGSMCLRNLAGLKGRELIRPGGRAGWGGHKQPAGRDPGQRRPEGDCQEVPGASHTQDRGQGGDG
jgi:hypothetical protein